MNAEKRHPGSSSRRQTLLHRTLRITYSPRQTIRLRLSGESALDGGNCTPRVADVGEGVYALIDTRRETHLAYLLTRPAELDQVQTDLGLRTSGSFVTLVKNPQAGGPSSTNLSDPADYPKKEACPNQVSHLSSHLAPRQLAYLRNSVVDAGCLCDPNCWTVTIRNSCSLDPISRRSSRVQSKKTGHMGWRRRSRRWRSSRRKMSIESNTSREATRYLKPWLDLQGLLEAADDLAVDNRS